MAYYIDVFSPQTHAAFSASDRTVSGHRVRHRQAASRLQNGDLLLCYLTKLSRWVGILEENGSPREPRLKEDVPCPVAYVPRNMQFVPAGVDLWGVCAGMRFVKDATLSFAVAELAERFETAFCPDALTTPRLRFSDDRIWSLVSLLADAVSDADPSVQLYGDSIAAAIVSRLLPARVPTASGGRGLTPWQLRRVLEYMDARLPGRIELGQLAAQVNLSQAHFSRAFKISTGMAPYQWQLDARIRRAKSLLLNGTASLDEIAESTGFADAVHFGRTFRRLTGATPGAWRRDRRR